MNKIIYAGVFLLLFACNNDQQETFSVTGTIKNSKGTMVYLEENPAEAQPVIVDSAKIEPDGRFDLAAVVKEEGMYSLRTSDQVYPFALLINDSRQITVDADIASQESPYSVKGSDASQAMLEFDRKTDQGLQVHLKSLREIDSLNRITNIPQSEKKILDSLINVRFNEYETNADELKNYAKDFIGKSKSAVLALYAYGSFQTRATQYGMKGFNHTETAEIINQAAARFPDHTVLTEQKKKLRPATAPDFTMPDTNGNPMALSSFKGKWVLLDFWASWCVPCRKENPNIVAAFRQFSDKNFTILGVSLDDNKNAWLQAIQEDSLAWNHVSDLQHWKNEAAVLYGVRSIPYNVLVDPSGNIVAENLHGRDLPATIARLIK